MLRTNKVLRHLCCTVVAIMLCSPLINAAPADKKDPPPPDDPEVYYSFFSLWTVSGDGSTSGPGRRLPGRGP